jgi:hypothetical protein
MSVGPGFEMRMYISGGIPVVLTAPVSDAFGRPRQQRSQITNPVVTSPAKEPIVLMVSSIVVVHGGASAAQFNGRKHARPLGSGDGDCILMLVVRFVEFGQGMQSMSPALRDLEQAVLERQLAHGDHPVLNMCANNTVIVLDDAGNRKPSKKRSVGRIDGIVALAMAIGVAPLKPVVIDVRALIG